MADSRNLAGLIGPALLANSIAEAMNMDAFANQIAPVVYLNGMILFVAGLALVRSHNLWTRDWRVLVTLTGWALLLTGLWRIIAPNAPQADENAFTYAFIAAIAMVGAILTFMGYRRGVS